MITADSFSNAIYENQLHTAESELSAFVRAVAGCFGPNEATQSTEDWLEESDLLDSPPRSTSRNWHSVTIAASARLANRLNVAKISPAPASDCSESENL